MKKWVRRSLETAILTAGFVAVGTGTAYASAQGASAHEGSAEGTASELGKSGLSDTTAKAVDQTSKAVHSTVRVFEKTGSTDSHRSGEHSKPSHDESWKPAGRKSPGVALNPVTDRLPAKSVPVGGSQVPLRTEAVNGMAGGMTSGAAGLPKPGQVTGSAAGFGALTGEMLGAGAVTGGGRSETLSTPRAHGLREDGFTPVKPGTAGVPAGLTVGSDLTHAYESTMDPRAMVGKTNGYVVVPTESGHELTVFDGGVNGRDGSSTRESSGVLGNVSAPLSATALSIDSGRDVQHGSLDQSGSAKGTHLLGAVDMPIAANALAVDSGNTVQNGDVKQDSSGGHGVVGVANTPVTGNLGTWHTGNTAQNGDVTQSSDQSGDGAFRLVDSWNVPVNGQHLAIHNGNTTQNGDVTQNSAVDESASQFGGAGNLNMPVNGSWLSFDSHNATQNGDVTQSTDSSGVGSVFSIVDNANTPVNGSGQAGHIANVSQNGDVTQENTYEGESGSFGSTVTGVRNWRLPVAGAGQAGDVANNSQNGDVSQQNRGTTQGSSVSIVDNGIFTAAAAGQGGVIANSVQNGNVSQTNESAPSADSKDAGSDWASNGTRNWGSDVRLARNLLVEASGAGQAGEVGNASQNGDRTQTNAPTTDGSAVMLADNAIVNGTGAGQAGVVGNAVQNGDVEQTNTGGEGAGTDKSSSTWGWGSAVQGFRNLDLRAVGAGQAGVVGNGAQNQHVTQTDTAGNPGFLFGVADNANLAANGAGQAGVVGNGAQNGTVAQNAASNGGAYSSHDSYGYGSAIMLFRNLNFPIIGQGDGGVTGNGSQNRDVLQDSTAAANGSNIRFADNASTPIIGQGVGGLQGNGAQNGSTAQRYESFGGELLPDGRSHDLGSTIRAFGNWDVPLNGSGVSLENGNGSQNSNLTQSDTATTNGTSLGLADNLNAPIIGTGVGGFSGDGSQNGNVDQSHIGDSGYGGDFTLIGHNVRSPIIATYKALAVGHGSQNGNVEQANVGNGANDIKLSGNHDLPVNANAFILGTGNGVQNVDTDFTNESPSVNNSGMPGVGLIDNPHFDGDADGIGLVHTNPEPGERPETVQRPRGGLFGGLNQTLVSGVTSGPTEEVLTTDLGRGGLTRYVPATPTS